MGFVCFIKVTPSMGTPEDLTCSILFWIHSCRESNLGPLGQPWSYILSGNFERKLVFGKIDSLETKTFLGCKACLGSLLPDYGKPGSVSTWTLNPACLTSGLFITHHTALFPEYSLSYLRAILLTSSPLLYFLCGSPSPSNVGVLLLVS